MTGCLLAVCFYFMNIWISFIYMYINLYNLYYNFIASNR